jgi:hypothetical protein
MARIRKINVSQVEGNNNGVLPAGTIAAYEVNGEYVLRVHDGVTPGGVPFPNAPSIVHNNDINITVNSEDSSSYTWNFGQTGTLTAPGMAVFGGTDGIVVDDLNEGIAALFNNGDVYITGGESLRFTGLDNIEGESSAVLRFWNGEGRHSLDNDTTELVTLNVGNDADSGDPTLGFFKIITEKQVGGEKEWKFDSSGALTFPDGSVQTTAYALPSGPLYVIVNESKEISTSTNGEIWTTGQEIITSATNFQRVAVGTNAIVYIGQIEDPNDNQNTEDAVFYQTTIGENATAARVTQFEIGAYDFKEVIWAEDKFVLVGHTIVEGPDEPVLFTSTNGIDWTATDIDPTYITELGVNEFDDVYYDGTGFLITATGGIDNGAGGFYVTDPASPLGQNDFVPFVLAGAGEAVSVEFEELAYGGTGWIARAENDILHSFTGEFAPGQFEQPAVWTPLDVATPFKEFCGLDLAGNIEGSPGIVELEGGVIDGTYWIIFTTNEGHVGATSDLGVNWTFSIPEPDTATMSFVTIDLAGITSIALDAGLNPGEKITISNSEIPGLDGTYYVDNPGDSTNANILYTDSALTTPKISQAGGTPGESNVVTRGVGVYLDAASIINGFMYVANDDEQIFRSTDGETWIKVDDQNDSFSYWNDIGYNPQFGQAGLSSSLTNGEYTLTLESNGVVILPQGGAIAEGVVTDNPTIELTPANPDDSTQKLVIKGGGSVDYHLHLTTGDLTETSIFLGTDDHNVRTTVDGGISMTTTRGTVLFGNVPDNPITGSSHFHIMKDSPSTVDLFFGDDYNYVKLPSSQGVEIGASGSTWTFGTDGTTTFPDDKIKCPISDSISIETEILPTAPPTTIVISGADFVAVNLTYIKDPYDPNWFPADYNPLTDPHITYQDSQWKILSPGFAQAPYVNTGTINVPLAQWNTNPPLGSVAPTGVYTYADTYTRTWQFGSNGNLTLPNNSTISDTPAVAQYSSSFSMGAYADDGVVGYFTARSDFHYTGNPLINTVTAGWFVSGPGLIGVKEIIAKTAAGEPGDWAITVDLTDGSTWPFDESSYTFYSPDYQIVPAGSTLTVNSNEWKFGANGSLTFPDATVQTTAYNPNSIRSEGDINIDINLSDSTLRRWSFGEDGNLNIPGDIITSTGTVLQSAQRVEGSWTVTAGTNTYSFTLPSDGTYTMWVKGNIPNGIIVWNATASVSNTNVPAIGTQYAWNYTGGGSPISLTSIPDQIKGVAGTISTDATYVGTTSNRFDFGISNTSGASQTIYYGYTKI